MTNPIDKLRELSADLRNPRAFYKPSHVARTIDAALSDLAAIHDRTFQRVVNMLVAAGFVDSSKVAEAMAIASDFPDVSNEQKEAGGLEWRERVSTDCPQQLAPTYADLPGTWDRSDFTGGDPDERSYAERTQQPARGGEFDYVGIANRAQEATGRSIWPSTVKAVLDEALAQPRTEQPARNVPAAISSGPDDRLGWITPNYARGWNDCRVAVLENGGVPLPHDKSEQPAAEGCRCQSCGQQYIADLLVPDDVWAKISNGCNLLCPTCLLTRIVGTGIWTAERAQDIDAEGPGEAVAWQARRTDKKHEWETCTRDFYEQVKRSGRYFDSVASPPAEARQLYAGTPPRADVVVDMAMVHKACSAFDPMYESLGDDTRADMQRDMRRALTAALNPQEKE